MSIHRKNSADSTMMWLRISLFFLLGLGLLGGDVWPARRTAAEVIEPEGPAKTLARCGRGALLEISGQRVLLLAGTPYEMGYQQGCLMKNDVKQLVTTVLMAAQAARLMSKKDALQAGLKGAFAQTRKYIDARYHEEMRGLAAGAEISLPEVQMANIFPELFHCSGFAFFERATEGGRLLHGRILDYMTEVGLQNHAVVTVVKPEGFHPFVTVGYAGFLGSVTGMNARQVAIGEMGGRGEGQWDGMPMTFLVRKALEETDTLEAAVTLFRDTPRTCEYFYVISDGKSSDARGLACTPERFETIKPGQSHPRLPHAIPDAVLMSAGERYEHLAGLVKAHHGRITLANALDMMNRPVAMKSCLHRVLFAPAEGTLWVANAAPCVGEKYAACYQPYYPYNFKKLLALIPNETPPGVRPVLKQK